MVGLILGTGGNGADLTQVTAAASDVAKGKVIVGPDGQPITGTLDTYDVTEITPKSTAQTINGPIIIPNGGLTVKAVPTQAKTVYIPSDNQTVVPDAGKFLSSVGVKGVKTYVGQAAFVKSYALNVNPDNIPFEKLYGIEVYTEVSGSTLAANMMLAAFVFAVHGVTGLGQGDALNSISLYTSNSKLYSFDETHRASDANPLQELYISTFVKGAQVYISSSRVSVVNKFNSNYNYICRLHYSD